MYVMITKTYGDVVRKKGEIAFPDEWPKDCEQFETRELALAKYPDRAKYLMTADEYNSFSKGLALAHDHLPKAKAWWQFWSTK